MPSPSAIPYFVATALIAVTVSAQEIPVQARQLALDSFHQQLTKTAPRWTPVHAATTDAGRVLDLIVDPRDANVAYAGFDTGGVWKTIDSGVQWTPITDDALAIGTLAIDPLNPDILYAGTIALPYGAGILKSIDAGATWSQISGPFATPTGWLDVVSIAVRGDKVLTATRQSIFRSEDAGKTWTATLTGRASKVIFDDSAKAFAAIDNLGIFQSTDGGQTWLTISGRPKDGPTTMALASSGVLYSAVGQLFYKNGNEIAAPEGVVNSIRVNPRDPDVLFAGSSQSRDGGQTWTRISQAVTAFSSDGARVYFGNDHGQLWTSSPPPLAGPRLRDTAYSPHRKLTKIEGDYITYSGFGSGHIFRNATDISANLPDIPVNDLLIDPDVNGTLYAATDIGVYRTEDSGATWQPFGSGLPHAIVASLSFNRTTRILEAKTTGRGIWHLPLIASNQVQVVIASTVPGAPFALEDGTIYRSPVTFTWNIGSSHTVNWLATSGQLGTRFVFQGWSDSNGQNPRVLFVPASGTGYTAITKAQYQLSTSTAPAVAGTLVTTPASPDGFYDTGTVVQVNPFPAVGFNFTGFSGDLTGPSAPQGVTMTSPRSVVANFACRLTYTAPLSGRQGPGATSGFIQWTTGAGCNSTISSDSAWLVLGASSGSGNSTIPFSIAQNPTFPRTATIMISGDVSSTLSVSQDFPTSQVPSVTSITPNTGTGFSQNFTLQLYDVGGFQIIDNVTVNFPAGAGCNVTYNRVAGIWYASLIANNATGGFLAPLQVPGSGTVANNRCQLNASQFAISGLDTQLTFTFSVTFFTSFIGENQIVVQAGASRYSLYAPFNMVGSWTVGIPGCSYNISGPTAIFGNLGGQSAFTLTTGGACPWSASSDSSWLTVTSARSGVGNVSINYTVTPNTSGGQRTGVLNIAGQNFTIIEGTPLLPTLSITSSHTGSFYQGQQPATYSLVVSNAIGAFPTTGTVTVTESVPTGLSFASMSGTGWICTGASCTRIDSLNPGSSYPPIIATVNVLPNAPISVTNAASVAGGGSTAASATDLTTVVNRVSSTGPSVISISPMTSVGTSQTFTFQFAHLSGYTNLNVVNILMNTALDGRHGCYMAYVVQTNTMYLVNDAGDAGGPYAGSFVVNGTGGGAVNSQCTIIGGGSSSFGNGTSLTLTLQMTFNTSFAGNKVIYAAAGDNAQNNSGWQTMGVHGIAPLFTTFPTPVSMNPSSITGSNATVAFTFADATLASNLQTGWALINTAIDGRAACYIAYYRPGNQVFLFPDSGDGTQATSIVLSGTNTIGNSQCTVSSQGSYATTNGADQLIVNLKFTFAPTFSGPKGVWMAVATLNGQTSPWQALGAWLAP